MRVIFKGGLYSRIYGTYAIGSLKLFSDFLSVEQSLVHTLAQLAC